MRSKFTRVVGVAVAVATAATVALISTSASALPPGTPAFGPVTLTPPTGNSATTMTMLPPSGAVCPGDSASGGYRWQTFIAAASIDPATLTYDSSGPVPQGGALAYPMFTTTGSPVNDQNTAVTTGLIGPIPTLSFGSVFAPGDIPAGLYNVGFACTLGPDTMRFWSAPMTITTDAGGGPSQINYAFGAPSAVPAAPVLASPLTAGSGTLAGTFTATAATPAITGFTVTAVPTAGATVTLPLGPGATSFTLTGLTNGTSYVVSLVATNSVGDSPASNVVSGTPNFAARPPITNLASSQIPGPGAHLTWTPPTGDAPSSYTIASPTAPGAPYTAPAGSSSFDVSGLTAGTPYEFTITANYAAAPLTGPTAGPVSFTFVNTVIIQDITVVRPAGALILTQRCGVYGPLPSEPASDGFPVLPALPASVDQIGTAPTTGAAPGGPADPQFPNYPFPSPASYPTHCGVDLGTGTFVTTGPLAGQYYAANGRINQVTVSDNRDTGAGWTVNGTMSSFANSSSTFSGNNLGWHPVVSSTTPGQTVTAGATVLPLAAAGLGDGEPLASAAAGAATGITTLDARLKLLIPVTAATGTFTGALTLSAI